MIISDITNNELAEASQDIYNNPYAEGNDVAQWVRSEHIKAEINRAGRLLVPWWKGESPAPPELGEKFRVIDNWRISHAMPLLTFRVNLERRTKRVDNSAIVAQRIKRFSSVMNKLVREPQMELTQMQDLGGCRAIVSNIANVERLFGLYNPGQELFGQQTIKYDNYIQKPKRDGYRGIHIIERYRAQASKNEPWNGQRIEIQLRTQLQHVFATTVETVTTFTQQPLKFGGGPEEWKRLFSLVGSAFAICEGTAQVCGTPSNKTDLISELREHTDKLKVFNRLRGWTVAMTKLRGRNTAKFKWLLMVLNVKDNTIRVNGYDDAAKATHELAAIEQESRSNEKDAVLVWVGSIKNLRRAYPNYYADTREFLKVLSEILNNKFVDLHK